VLCEAPLAFSCREALLARQRSLVRVAEEGLEGIRRPLLLRVSAILPCGASVRAGVPSYAKLYYSITLFTHSLFQL
jgi:hypothetical protein